jgi:hypothetical protein
MQRARSQDSQGRSDAWGVIGGESCLLVLGTALLDEKESARAWDGQDVLCLIHVSRELDERCRETSAQSNLCLRAGGVAHVYIPTGLLVLEVSEGGNLLR